MEIRTARVGDEAQLRALWRIAFAEDSADHVEWFFCNRFEPQRGLVLTEGGSILSGLYLLPYSVRLRGKTMNAPFVVGAATLPRERGRGLMAKLLREAYARLRESGEAVSMLYPFRYGFYRRLGYEVVTGMCEYTVRLSALRDATSSPLFSRGREGLSAAPLDAASLRQAYDAMMARFDTAMVRSEALCFQRLDEWSSDHLLSMQCSRGSASQGYALYARHNRRLYVSELVYRDGAALLFLLDQLAGQAQEFGFETVTFPMPPDEPLDFLFEDSRGIAKYNPFAMLRVVDVCALLTGMELSGVKPFSMRVYDAQCPWNDGVFRVEPGRNTRAEKAAGAYDVSLTVQTLSQLAAGYIGGREAFAMGLLEGNARAADAFDRRKCYAFDIY